MLTGLSPAVSERKPFLTGAVELSFGGLRDNVARTRGLLGRLGLRPGDRVAIASARDEAVSSIYGACLLGGFVTVMLDPSASASEANVLLAKANVSVVFADEEMIERAGQLQGDDSVPVVPVADPAKSRTGFGLIIRKKAKAEPATSYPAMLADVDPVADRPDLDEDGPALILFTSGTTSQPKGVVLSRRSLAAQLVTFRNHYGYSAESRIGNHLPLHHSDGLNQGALLAMALGSTWIRPAGVDLQTLGEMLDLLYRERATHLITVPTVIAMMTRLPDTYDDALADGEFEFISSTAGFLDEGIWRRVEDRFETTIVNSYGLTETVMEALYCGPTEATRRVGTIGRPVDCEARIVDEGGNDVAPGEVGELWLRGENIMLGYFEAPDATAEVLVGGWLRTGDLAVIDGGFYSIAGRKKNVIIRAGVNVYPEDVNSVLTGRPDVDAAATVGVPDDFLGESVIAVVTSTETDVHLDVNQLMAHCREQLSDEKVPNRILVLDALPFGPSGKVELAKVVQAVSASMNGAAVDGSARDQVFAIAAGVFGQPIESLAGSSAANTTPGWDSLSFLELVVALERRFDMTIPPRDVMTLKTLDDAVDLVESR